MNAGAFQATLGLGIGVSRRKYADVANVAAKAVNAASQSKMIIIKGDGRTLAVSEPSTLPEVIIVP
ncbi:hypothetical protein [Methylosinus sp. LW4]|uniref:hypothetical protein n=1 Tax=Methylosinus sp. LW4 TaxID=136993 RepID=UPI0012FB4FDA|nr:hypothetical protein [Methylosinus sp. LW4]